MSILVADVVLRALEDAGVIRTEDNIRRVVIDLEVGNVPVIHVERYGDERLLSVVAPLAGVEIHRD